MIFRDPSTVCWPGAMRWLAAHGIRPGDGTAGGLIVILLAVLAGAQLLFGMGEQAPRTVFHHDKEGRDLKIEVYAPGGIAPLQTVREVGPEGIASERQYDLVGNVKWERTVSVGGNDSVAFVQDGAFRTVRSRWFDAAGRPVRVTYG